MIVTGRIVRDDAFGPEYRDFKALAAASIQWHPSPSVTQDQLVSFTADDVLVTSCCIPVDLARARLFLHYTYSGIEQIFPLRFALDRDRFTLESEPIRHRGRHVLLGGPIDGVWYHWLVNWCLRLVVLKRLRPHLFLDPAVRFVVHPTALTQPFRAVLDTFGIPAERLLGIDPKRDHLFEEATLVSFCDQKKLYPELVRALSTHLVEAFGASAGEGGGRRIFASRQHHHAPRRRIHNFDAVEPVLRGRGFEIATPGAMSAAEQVRTFRGADVVVGAHGSDLTNILFCRPGTRVLVFEHASSVARGLHHALQCLAEIMELDFHIMLAPSGPLPDWILKEASPELLADYVIDPHELAGRLAALAPEPATADA